MLKKTTIYLEETELQKLKALSFVMGTSMTDLIRKGIEGLYNSMPKDKKDALKSLATTKSGFSEGKTKASASKKSNSKGSK